ncbi:hypothetical protein ACLKA7_017716, partial [Drosophila subpalustris]
KNPADIISRGFRASDLLTSMWMKGPGFLKLPSDEWPKLKEPLQRAATPDRSTRESNIRLQQH